MELKELPHGWQWYKLKDIAIDFINGGTPSTTNENYWNGQIPWTRSANINSNYLDSGEKFISQKALDEASTNIVPKNNVLIATRVGIGKSTVTSIDVAISQDITGVVLKYEKILPLYLVYYLHSPQLIKKFEYLSRGTTIKGITRSDLEETPIPVPPLVTQRKIIPILDCAEATKQLRSQADSITQQLLQSTFLELFGDPLKNHRNWKTVLLRDVAEVVSGVTKGRDFGGKNIIMAPYLRVANVQDGYLDLSEIKEIEALDSDIEKYALEEGDVLLTEGGDRDKLGRGAVWQGEIPNCIHQNHIFRVRANRDLLVPEYLSSLIGSTYGKLYFLRSAKQTTGIASINSTQLKNFPVIIPPIELQSHFADIVSRIQKIDNNMLSSRITFNLFYDSLMSKAFTGELVV